MKKEEFIALGVAEELAEKGASALGEELNGYISKSRFDEINSEKTNLKEALSERDKQLEELKKNSKGKRRTAKADGGTSSATTLGTAIANALKFGE